MQIYLSNLGNDDMELPFRRNGVAGAMAVFLQVRWIAQFCYSNLQSNDLSIGLFMLFSKSSHNEEIYVISIPTFKFVKSCSVIQTGTSSVAFLRRDRFIKWEYYSHAQPDIGKSTNQFGYFLPETLKVGARLLQCSVIHVSPDLRYTE